MGLVHEAAQNAAHLQTSLAVQLESMLRELPSQQILVWLKYGIAMKAAASNLTSDDDT